VRPYLKKRKKKKTKEKNFDKKKKKVMAARREGRDEVAESTLHNTPAVYPLQST
jgi:hypothetical protein